jgi:hypothetical protein
MFSSGLSSCFSSDSGFVCGSIMNLAKEWINVKSVRFTGVLVGNLLAVFLIAECSFIIPTPAIHLRTRNDRQAALISLLNYLCTDIPWNPLFWFYHQTAYNDITLEYDKILTI